MKLTKEQARIFMIGWFAFISGIIVGGLMTYLFGLLPLSVAVIFIVFLVIIFFNILYRDV
jgi:uncharacterized membrane protein YoaK (UPF0700 family)